MSRHARRAFTLIEVLVVIAIIAMLAGLLLPAINRARESARRGECQNNSREIALAIKHYETSKQRLPGSKNPQPGTPTSAVGWVPVLLPYLEQNELHKIISTNQTLPPDTNVKILLCPSDSLRSLPLSLSYAANSGRTDNPSPTTTAPADYPANGVFLNLFNGGCQPIDSTFVSRHDGTTNTIMLSENADSTVWWDATSTLPNCPTEGFQDIVWSPTDPPAVPLNNYSNNIGKGTGANARPSSYHIAGFNVAMCDGSVKFLSEDIEYRVYAMLMTPDGNGAKETTSAPPINAGDPATYPSTWRIAATGSLKPITPADLEK